MGLVVYLYPISLAIISVLVATLEWLFPWRKEQKQIRKALFSDFLHLLFNGHFLGLILAGLAVRYVLPYVDQFLAHMGWTTYVYRNAAASWPIWVQIVVALFVVDFVQWCVHNLLHRIPFFWEMHKCHHSVVDGEMDWIVSFRFQWTEVVVYKTVLYLPLVFFGFGMEALLFHAIFGTLIGHLNHANLNLGHGWWRYILNSPRMHIWHHYYEGDEKTTVNFGIIFSIWDWIFGTGKMPAEPPPKLGFHGVEEYPTDFFGQEAWPLQEYMKPNATATRVIGGTVGVVVLALGYWLATRPVTRSIVTPMLGETAASSQPMTKVRVSAASYSATPEEATQAIAAFGTEARKAGYLHPESMVSVPELAKALGSPRLVLLDIRPEARFATGHIPSAQRLYRADYSFKKPIAGLSREAAALQALLRSRGASKDSVIVLYTDGGPEAFRLWWTLKRETGFKARLLDGGMNAWKAMGHGIAEGKARKVKEGDIVLSAPKAAPLRLWKDLETFRKKPKLVILDTRGADEYTGKKHHRNAGKAGRIPKSRHMVWHSVIRSEEDRRLKSVADLKKMFAKAGVAKDTNVLGYCQSGTRSAAVYFALYQIGHPTAQMMNYDGSWAEYSHLPNMPIETGKPKL
ncbi:MAG: sterol desaturase family protein [Myxococcales bacterium]|nr:sterol desaturase family protein [Myxococcales bacterium]